VKLNNLDEETEIKREIANRYISEIVNTKVTLPKVQHKMAHVWHLFVIRTENRNALQTYLTEKGIQTVIHYPIPPHHQKAYLEWNELSFPISELMHDTVISLPISAVMTADEVGFIIETINAF